MDCPRLMAQFNTMPNSSTTGVRHSVALGHRFHVTSTKTAANTESEDWQNGRGILETNLYMLDHEIACDIHLLLGESQVRVPAHKFMLVSRSPVFYAMFCGGLPETGHEVVIPDIDAGTFKAFLRYLYTGEVELGPESVMALMYTAKKYSVESLVDACTSYLGNEINNDNVCTVLEQAHLFDESELRDQCLDTIFANARDVFSRGSTDFYNLCFECMKTLLGSDKLVMKEELIYTACTEWAGEQCRRKGNEVTDENIRDKLGNILFLIRFANMGMERFTELVSTTDILKDEEKVSIYQQMCRSSSRQATHLDGTREVSMYNPPPAGVFSSKPRQAVNIHRVDRFLEIAGSTFDFWLNDCATDAISFSCSRDIKLLGISIFCPFKDETLVGSVALFDGSNRRIAKGDRLEIAYDERKIHDVKFKRSVDIQQGKWYTVEQRMRGAKSYLGRGGQRQVAGKTVTFTFRRSPIDGNETEVESGQIPALLYC